MTATPTKLEHTLEVPCPACRFLVKGDERNAMNLYHAECGHFHDGRCPAVAERGERRPK